MERFSKRYGIVKPRSEIQVDSIDEALLNSLWSLLELFYWRGTSETTLKNFATHLWFEYFKEPIDTIPYLWLDIHEKIREYFFHSLWWEVYDFIEYVANNFPDEKLNKEFMEACNEVLEEELSAYRFVGGRITRITTEEEISEIEEALESPVEGVRVHLTTALKLMSDRKSPDYRNSIKESISAVESLCKIIAKDEKATLGRALDIIEKKIGLRKALKRAFDSLYGYTSSAEGIRHALLEEPSLTFEDAKFMLVSCSAFINYLISKASKARLI